MSKNSERRRGTSLVTPAPEPIPDLPPPYSPSAYGSHDAVEESFEDLLRKSPVPSLHWQDVLAAASEEDRQVRVYLTHDVMFVGRVRCVRSYADGLFKIGHEYRDPAWPTYFFANDVVSMSVYDATKEIGS